MKFKIFLVTLCCFFMLISCKNNDSSVEDSETDSRLKTSESESPIQSKEIKDQSKTLSSSKTESKDSLEIVEGTYIKVGEESDSNCECYCLDLSFTSISDLCISPNKIYINVKYEKTNNNSINVYLTGPSNINSEGDKMPWDKFDKDLPIAIITLQNNGNLELDWLGFSIDDDLAIEYAIFGKKTLEGEFKKI